MNIPKALKNTRYFLNGNNFNVLCLFFFLLPRMTQAHPVPPKKEYYSLLVYHLKDKGQEARLDDYCQQALIPFLHKQGFGKIGVFKPVTNDTTLYVLIPSSNLEKLLKWPENALKDAAYLNNGKDYVEAAWDHPVYSRMETIILEAFPEMPRMEAPNVKDTGAIYELRSYEGPTERLYQNKVEMFNKGNEVGIFKRLGFNAVFYASVVSGSRMPNLMYMTSFVSRAEREAHWKAFGADAEWKKLIGDSYYAHNVSHQDIILCHAAAYSEY